MTLELRPAALLLSSVLKALDIPRVLPGDAVYAEVARRVEVCGPDVSLRTGAAFFYDLDGAPIEDASEGALSKVRALRETEGSVLRSPQFYREGVRAQVGTTYMGIDMSTWSTPVPLVWESTAFIDETFLNDWRYATRAAAHAGHEQIVAAMAAWVAAK